MSKLVPTFAYDYVTYEGNNDISRKVLTYNIENTGKDEQSLDITELVRHFSARALNIDSHR